MTAAMPPSFKRLNATTSTRHSFARSLGGGFFANNGLNQGDQELTD